MTTVTLYRADNADLYCGAGSCWTERRNDAEAYTDNQGFGGPVVHQVTHEMDNDRVLDLTGDNPFQALASAIGVETYEIMDCGGHIYHAWENNETFAAQICDRYDWVKYTDDFPVGCTTWRKMN
jgi:hypothetical protein